MGNRLGIAPQSIIVSFLEVAFFFTEYDLCYPIPDELLVLGTFNHLTFKMILRWFLDGVLHDYCRIISKPGPGEQLASLLGSYHAALISRRFNLITTRRKTT